MGNAELALNIRQGGSSSGVSAIFSVWTPTQGTTLINAANDTLGDAHVISLAGSDVIFNASVWCAPASGYTLLSSRIQLSFLGISDILDKEVSFQSPQACPVAVAQMTFSIDAADLSAYRWILSGAYLGNFTVLSSSGSALAWVSFIAKLVPPFPVTILTLVLLIVAAYEVYAFVEAVWKASKRPPPSTGRSDPGPGRGGTP